MKLKMLLVSMGVVPTLAASVFRKEFDLVESLAAEAVPQDVSGDFPQNPVYITEEWFSDIDCSNRIFVHNIVTDTCLKGAGGSLMYHCASQSMGQVSTYVDDSCQGAPDPLNLGHNQCTLDPASGMYFKVVACGRTAAEDFGDGKWFTKSYFDSSSQCNANTIHSVGFVDGECLEIGGAGMSRLYKYPDVTTFPDSTACQGGSLVSSVGSDCVSRNSGDDDGVVTLSDDTLSPLSGSHTPNQPSHMHSRAPVRVNTNSPAVLTGPAPAPAHAPALAPQYPPSYYNQAPAYLGNPNKKFVGTMENLPLLDSSDASSAGSIMEDVLSFNLPSSDIQTRRKLAVKQMEQQDEIIFGTMNVQLAANSMTYQQYSYTTSEATSRLLFTWSLTVIGLFSMVYSWRN